MADITMKSWLQLPESPRARKCSIHAPVKSAKSWSEHPQEAAKMVVIRSLRQQYHAAIRRWTLSTLSEDTQQLARDWFPSYSSVKLVAMADLHNLANAINESQTLPPPNHDMDQLLMQALQARGTPRDIKEWAARLAGDIGDLTD
jgi:hypothetical protein